MDRIDSLYIAALFVARIRIHAAIYTTGTAHYTAGVHGPVRLPVDTEQLLKEPVMEPYRRLAFPGFADDARQPKEDGPVAIVTVEFGNGTSQSCHGMMELICLETGLETFPRTHISHQRHPLDIVDAPSDLQVSDVFEEFK